eukprot:2866016-Amphidinium_carterae.1
MTPKCYISETLDWQLRGFNGRGSSAEAAAMLLAFSSEEFGALAKQCESGCLPLHRRDAHISGPHTLCNSYPNAPVRRTRAQEQERHA